MTATARQEKELKVKCEKIKENPNVTPWERLRAHVLLNGVCSLKTLAQSFKNMDYNGDGIIDFKEFQSALHRQGIIADEATEMKCFKQMDWTNSGAISYGEFLKNLKPGMSPCRRNIVMQAFRKLDRDNNGVITIDDIRGRFNPKKHPKYLTGEWSEDQVLQNWLKSFDGPGVTSFDGKITYEDFENYYTGVSASIELDCAFDLIMRQAWSL